MFHLAFFSNTEETNYALFVGTVTQTCTPSARELAALMRTRELRVDWTLSLNTGRCAYQAQNVIIQGTVIPSDESVWPQRN